MKFFPRLFLGAIAGLAFTTLASAQSIKIASIDMQVLFKEFYKTAEAQKGLEVDRALIQKENAERFEKIQKIDSDLNALLKSYKDPAASETAKKAANEKISTLRTNGMAIDKERRDYIERRGRALEERLASTEKAITDEISKMVEEKARLGEYDLVIDRSCMSLTRTKVFMYSKDSIDITPVVLEELNKNAPKSATPAAPKEGEKAPATPAASK